MKNLIELCLLAAALPLATSAAEPDYSYLEAGLSQSSLRTFSGGNGYAIDGSAVITGRLFVDGRLEQTRFDDRDSSYGAPLGDITLDRDTVHLGWVFPLREGMDLFVRAGATRLKVETAFDPNDELGSYDAGMGLRADLGAGFEFEGDISVDRAAFTYVNNYRFVGAGTRQIDETYAGVAMRYHFTDQFLLGLSYSLRHNDPKNSTGYNDMYTWLLAARWDF